MQTTLGRGSCKLRVACPVRCGLIAAHICAMNLHVCRRLLSWKKKKKERRFFVVVASPDAAGHLRGGTRRSLVTCGRCCWTPLQWCRHVPGHHTSEWEPAAGQVMCTGLIMCIKKTQGSCCLLFFE
uniref:Uncharacterized protein n=1 Tax=Gasterosteus aculeatus TaxID=69293 RepID=G3PB38_GASAC